VGYGLTGDNRVGRVRTSTTLAVITALSGVVWPVIAPAGQPVTLAVTGTDGQPVAGVALYLADVHTPGTAPPAIVDQRREKFVPAVSIVTVGDEVQFTNSDPTSHHVYSFSRPNAFALPLYKGDESLATRFTRAGVVVLGCNIHDSMLGYVVIVDSTRRGITGADGRVTLTDVPPGRHAVRAWAPGFDRDEPPQVGVIVVSESAPASGTFSIAGNGSRPAAPKRGSLVGGDY
jgi:plastocyanin